MASQLSLVLGGVRSGKSAFAEELAGQAQGPVLYLATGLAVDQEMAQRIRRHRELRSAHWKTVEEALDLAGPLADADGSVLIDSMDAWLANMMMEHQGLSADQLENTVMCRLDGLLEVIDNAVAAFTLVSSEVGLSLVPVEPLGRRFQDLLGTINQRVAARADRVYMVVAGIPTQIKGWA